MDVVFKWIGIVTVMFLFARFIDFILKRLGIKRDLTWKELFQSNKKDPQKIRDK